MTAQGRRALGTQDEPAGREVGPSQPLLHAETKKKWAHKSVEMRPSQSTCKDSDDCKDLMTAESKDEEDRRSYFCCVSILCNMEKDDIMKWKRSRKSSKYTLEAYDLDFQLLQVSDSLESCGLELHELE
ncbi:hypothetical protein F443_21136 [Phytophthora nicotianae P1569]|uniref:Uncharacterized protein n=1 Tax=Phytophthora nicotianae P1569 TaxID=1317065 RepID=V9E125_PHYNI|nr:hypothetical protein F443_21136 [Phytophthora nicotianae P1569]